MDGVFENVRRHADLLTDPQKGGTAAQTEGNAIEAYALPAALSHQEIADGILAQLDLDAVVEASFENDSAASKTSPLDKAKIAAATRKNFNGAVRLNIEKQKKDKTTAKPAAKGAVASLF